MLDVYIELSDGLTGKYFNFVSHRLRDDGVEECEICGSKTKDVYIIDVEGAELRVCTKCAKGKRIVSKVVERPYAQRKNTRKGNEEDTQVVEDYGRIIHNAREAMRLPLKVLAEMLNEKETLLLRIEQQRTLPSIVIAKKLEKALNVKLTETGNIEENVSSSAGRGSGRITLGDFAGAAER